MTLRLPPYAEKLVSDYLRETDEVQELVDRRVVGKTPNSLDEPWVLVKQLDGPAGGAHHLFEFYFQFDCYAGSEGGQPEANLLARTVAATLAELDGQNYQAAEGVITGAQANVGPRVPDEDIKGQDGARERFLVTARIWAHS